MELEVICNGLGGPSMYMLWLACKGELTPRVSITADTGSENDRLTNRGERVTAKDFFDSVVKPLAEKNGVIAKFVRAQNKDGNDLPSLWDDVKAAAAAQDVPLFGSNGGRLRQTCTDKWKMKAIKQEARRMGAKVLISAIGMHVGEIMRRARGRLIGKIRSFQGKYNLFQHGITVDGEFQPVKWMKHYYPLADMRLSREAISEKLVDIGLPYLLTSECDHCPHKDGPRWLRTSQHVIDEIAKQEARYNGEFFFTDLRIPLKMAIEKFKEEAMQPSLFDEPDFGCQSGGYCGL